MEDQDRLISNAAWLGAIIDRIESGQPALQFGDENAMASDRKRFIASDIPRKNDNWKEAPCDPARGQLFDRILHASKNQSWERSLWNELLSYSPTPPPVGVVRDLLSREIAVELLGHLPLPDAVLWELSDKVPEALLTLGKRRYLNNEFNADQFYEVLSSFSTNEWLLSSLVALETPSVEKCRRLVEIVAISHNPEKLIRHQSNTFAGLWKARG